MDVSASTGNCISLAAGALAGLFAFGHLPVLPLAPRSAALVCVLHILFALGLMLVRAPERSRGRCSRSPVWQNVRFLLVAVAAAGAFSSYAMAVAGVRLHQGMPQGAEGADFHIVGEIATPPVRHSHHVSFEMTNVSLHDSASAVEGYRPAGTLRLAWYRDAPALVAGERWALVVRLKNVHSRHNPGGFDAERHALIQGISARGYVRDTHTARRLRAAPWFSVQRWRQHIVSRIRTHIDDRPVAALLAALAVGDRSGFVDADWRAFRDTGTSHLVAISGLHVGFVALVAAWLATVVVRRVPALCTRWPVRVAGMLAAVPAALLYAALAGFTIPTLRALIMLLVISIAVVSRRRINSARSISMAIVLVLLMDPLSALGAGFWLSFFAVIVIATVLALRQTGVTGVTVLDYKPDVATRRTEQLRRASMRLAPWIHLQVMISLAMLPISFAIFSEGSLIGIVTNALAIPVTTLVLVPGLLFAIGVDLLTGISAPLGAVGRVGAALMEWISWTASFGLVRLQSGSPGVVASLFAGIGTLALILPRRMPGRLLLAMCWLPFVAVPVSAVPRGITELTVLDVGQGLGAVIRHGSFVMVFDTGARYGSFTEAASVVVPWLRYHGVDAIDLLVISHGDNDHAGGAASLAARIPVARTISSVPQRLADAESCRRGAVLDVGEINIEVLGPDSGSVLKGSNNRSCVVMIRSRYGAVLLTGDIEADAEAWLVEQFGPDLAAQVLVVPHHGAATSSTSAFLEHVRPDVAIVSAGHRNRYGHPDPTVVARYGAHRIPFLNTATGGAITAILGPEGVVTRRDRDVRARFWHRWSDD